MIHPKERKLVDTRDKISFSLPKTLEAKEEQIREQTISISCCFSTPSFLKIEMRIASRILSSRALEEERRVLQPNCRQKKQKKKHLSFAYREQRHRVSSVDRFFAGREGHVRSSRNRFHGTLSLQAFGLGDRRFRAHVDGLDDRSHYY